ncbi:MAG: hypothetical protein K8W52_23640 [Deltaproteobacteria bacterium]|nr:hypothetical protein [Deltaproteobacteria bacterium]
MLGIAEGAVLGGPQRTEITAHDDAGVARVELYLDDARVAFDELAPFVLEWDTLAFAPGPHRLTARAFAADGRIGAATIGITIDNQAPTIATLPRTATVGVAVDLPVADETGIAHVVIAAGPDLITLNAPPWQWTPLRCGTLDVSIRVTDRAGWTADGLTSVDLADPDDLDCDLVTSSGGDCNDGDPRISPWADDLAVDLVDRNCDGLVGTDRDGDGVQAVGAGGADCNDADPTTHGPGFRWETREVPGSRTWAEVPAVAFEGQVLHIVYIDATNAVRYRATVSADYDGPSELVTDNPGIPISLVIQAGQPTLVYASSAGLFAAHRTPGGWSELVLGTEYPTAWPRTVLDASGVLHVVWASQSGIFAARIVDGAASIDAVDSGPANTVALVFDPAGTRHVLYAYGIPGASSYNSWKDAYETAAGVFAHTSQFSEPAVVGLSATEPGASSFFMLTAVANGSPELLSRYAWTPSGWATTGTVATLPPFANNLSAMAGHVFYEANIGSDWVALHAAVAGDLVSGADTVARAPSGMTGVGGVPVVLSPGSISRLVETIAPAPDGPDAIDHDCDGAAD